VETSGQIEIPLQDGSLFKLTAQPDRIEHYKDGHIAIIDYKTGTPPTQKEVEVGFASQLTLEAAMVTRGAFAITVKNEDIGESLYVQMIAQGELTPVKINATKMQEWTLKHYDGLVQLLNQFRNPDMPYLSRPYVKFTHRYADYDHLARVKEWSAGSEGNEE
jgi:ATP-dependent helicase/nuclease subunit B